MRFKWNVGQRQGETPWSTVLANRGVTNTTEEVGFLNPSLKGLHNPMLMHDMRKAAERIVAAIKAKDPITVYGDYDVDGVTGTVTLMLALKMFGAIVDYYIPSRMGEGYGIHSESIKDIVSRGAKLIVSVDCGITAVEPVKTANELGIDIIISDHHEWKEELPTAYALVHPRLGSPSTYPNPDLCGSGVAFKLAWAVGMLMNDGERVAPDCTPFFSNAIAFTALGTIADIVKLTGENRVIASCGLTRIRNTCFPGLKGFLASAKLEGEEIDGYKVGFTLAPRINAAGRMGHAMLAVKMLAEEDYSKALGYGETLEKQNIERQETEKKIVKDCEATVDKMMAAGVPTDVLIIIGAGWHPGVIGIVASRMVEKYHKPTLVLIQGAEHCHGSGRSIDGFNLTGAIASTGDLVKNFGGHEMACGCRIENGKMEAFRTAICAYAREHSTIEMRQPDIKIECEAKLDEMTLPLTESLVKVGPFGPGNRRPFFVFRNAIVRNIRRIGKEGQFLSFVAQQGDHALKAVWFKPTKEAFSLIDGDRIDIVAEPSANEWNNKVSVQMMVRDLELSDKAKELNIFS